jgi:hypothetical protein
VPSGGGQLAQALLSARSFGLVFGAAHLTLREAFVERGEFHDELQSLFLWIANRLLCTRRSWSDAPAEQQHAAADHEQEHSETDQRQLIIRG